MSVDVQLDNNETPVRAEYDVAGAEIVRPRLKWPEEFFAVRNGLGYETLGNNLPHLHTHVIPRYADDPSPGTPFPFPNTAPGVIAEDEFRLTVESLDRSLN